LTLVRKALWPSAIAIAFLLVLGSFGVRPAYADVSTVFVVDPDDIVDTCDDGDGGPIAPLAEDDAADMRIFYGGTTGSDGVLVDVDDDEYSIVQLDDDNSFWFCVLVDDTVESVDIDSDEVGEFMEVQCPAEADFATDPECEDVDGIGTDDVEVDPTAAGADITGGILVEFSCEDEDGTTTITVGQGGDTFEFVVMCKGDASTVTVNVYPQTTVEVVPAVGNTAHALIRVILEDSSGGPVMPDTEVQFSVDRCAIEEGGVDSLSEREEAIGDVTGAPSGSSLIGRFPSSWEDWHDFANLVGPDTSPLSDVFSPSPAIAGADSGDPGVLEIDGTDDDNIPEQSEALAIFHADLGGFGHAGSCAPGKATVTILVEVEDGSDITRTVELTIVGPPASITVAASPSTIRCGEKATITATVRDAIGQNVSEHTQVEMVTNLGGVLAGTGAVVSLAGPVVPVSSTVAETFSGVATAFLLTSDSHGGPYEVVVTAGGNTIGLGSGGLFSTAPISAQVTVNCAAPVTTAPVSPQPTVTAPRTGDLGPVGTIRPPSTGEAGLADSSGSSLALLLIGGVAAFTLAGLASLKFARR
jgi:hypothetical protein